MRHLVLTVIGIMAFGPAVADQAEEKHAHLRELDAKCLGARAAKLKVVQQEKVEQCVRDDGLDRTHCDRFFRDYGWGGANVMGGRTLNLFAQIPECEQSFKAWKSRMY